MSSYLKGVAYISLAALLWSSAGLFIKLINLPSLQIALYRSLVAGCFLLGYVAWMRRRLTPRPAWTVSRHTLLTAGCYMLTVTLFVMANKLTTAANAVFLQYTAPVYIILISYFILREHVDRMEVLTIVICLGGMVLFFFEENKSASLIGNLIGILSGVAFALLQLSVKKTPASERSSDPASEPLRATYHLALGNVLTVAVLAVLISLLMAGQPGEDAAGRFAAEAAGTAWSMTVRDLTGLVILGICQLGLGYLFFARGAKLISTVEISIYTLLEPVSNPVWTFLGTGEAPGRWAILGGGLVLTAILVNTLFQRRHSGARHAS